MKRLLSTLSAVIVGALVSVSAIAAPVTFGWFGSANPSAAITAAGNNSVALAGLTAGDLAGINVLWILNGSNSGAPGGVTANAAAIDAFVLAGGVLSYHDRYVSGGADSNAALIPGADLITFVRDFSDSQNIDIVTPGIVTNGPGGVIGNTTLDGGNSSSHGYTLLGSLPAGAVSVFSQTDVTHIVDFYYNYGAGSVYYSTIPLDFYLNGAGNNPPANAMRTIYAVNEAAQQASLVPSLVPEPGSIALLGLSLILLAAQRRKTRA